MTRVKAALCGACLLLAAATAPGHAEAADKPLVGPVPAWVRPSPDAPAETPAEAALPASLRLTDIQLDFDAQGWTEFHEIEAKVNASEGLQALGAIPFQWSPWSDTLTFHRARILRAGQAIDILPRDGAFTVLRREAGLERAMLTGELTALLQPEGLQVGDTIEVTVSVRHADPLLKGRSAALLAGWDGSPVARARLMARWPSALPVRWRATPGLPAPRRTEAAGVTTAVVEMEDVHPLVPPAHAPQRFQHGRQLEFTTFASWGEVAAVMAPLYAKAAGLDPSSPLHAEAQRIAAASPDPTARAAAVLQLVQGRVRYLAHAEAGGGYLPQSADETWRLRYGDCKAKTALLMALLGELGIAAEPVLASTVAGDGLDAHLPSPTLFDHVLVRVQLGGRSYWLDGAREGDRGLDALTVPAFGWVLPLGASDARLLRIGPAPAPRPQVSQMIRYDASGGISDPLPTRFETVLRGDTATVVHKQLAAVPADRMDAALRAYWANVHTAFTAAHVAAVYDPATGEERLSADGTSKLDWSGSGLELQNVTLGGEPDIKRDPASSDPDAPYLTTFPAYAETDESVVLPPGAVVEPATLKTAAVDETIAGVAYRRAATVSAGVLRVVASQRGLAPEATAAEVRASVDRLTKLGNQVIYAPAGERATRAGAEAAAIAAQPTTASAHVDRGDALMTADRMPEAVKEFDAAIALDPKTQIAWSDRAVAHAWMQDAQAARADLVKAEALGPPDVPSLHARALLAEEAQDWAAAAGFYRKALTLWSGDPFAASRLVDADISLKDYDAALRDNAAYLKAHPGSENEALGHRAMIEEAQHRHAQALQTLASAPAVGAKELLYRARLYRRLDATPQALADVDASIRLKPSVEAWLLRAELDGGHESAAALPDVEAAARLAPDDLDVRAWRVTSALLRGDWAAALPPLTRMIAEDPTRTDLRLTRAWVEGQMHQTAAMDADFEAVRRAAGASTSELAQLCSGEIRARWRPQTALADCGRALAGRPRDAQLLLDRALLQHRLGQEAAMGPSVDAAATAAAGDALMLNNLCYELATEGVVLERALAFCDASLKLSPDTAATLDSRGFVLMRLGRDAEALAAFDAALAKTPKLYDSLYGRSVVEARLRRGAEAARDLAAALAGRPAIRDEFAAKGVAPPPTERP